MNFQVTLIFQKFIYIKGEIYYSGVVTISSEDDENSAIILFLSEDTSDNDEKKYFLYFENTVGNTDVRKDKTRLNIYQDYV